jgi:glucose-1-phosphate adenylyltransferase
MKREIIAMLLAGGKGSRLLSLTQKTAKPAVFFGGKYRIIDFPLSNCTNSGIDVVGVLTQYESVQLNDYLGSGSKWGFDSNRSKLVMLPPRQKETGSSWYNGTADAIIHNLDFIDEYNPEYVLILSGDHIYKMDYSKMLAFHKKMKASCTIGAIKVPLKEASRFGIMNCDDKFVIQSFEEKPAEPKSDLASMGIYIFTYSVLKKYLLKEAKVKRDEHDFGKNVIPTMLQKGEKLVAYQFTGYWKDVGTVQSLWEANMDLLGRNGLDLFTERWTPRIMSEDTFTLPQYIGNHATVSHSLINQGSSIEGTVKDSVIFGNVLVKKGAKVIESVIFPDCVIEEGAEVYRCIVDNHKTIAAHTIVNKDNKSIKLV